MLHLLGDLHLRHVVVDILHAFAVILLADRVQREGEHPASHLQEEDAA
jgi:hypothetical protein